ncbi:hypothetical protein E3N88_19256 [Mikania micrantha]|uniref:Integrase catalytic domain-containing protein n=1 Tax=Mikania micrantha TaxID=192012 RepID=A0A5N6NPB1_9ASTR|nr:hypothetical protein E3N88_19256 [Mikania micrantha]
MGELLELASSCKKTPHPMIKETAVCEGCLVSKQKCKSFPKEAQWRASKPLELVHADICGPISPQTSGGNRYFMLIVYDFTRYTWVYLVNTKDQAFQKFKTFKTLVENESKYKVKMLRTDRWGEFTSQMFNDYCKQEGIKRQLTTPYTPQWGCRETILTKAVKSTTPFQLWKGYKPNLEHLKVFGCVGYATHLKGHLTKLEDRGKALVYLGAEDGTKGYRLLDPENNRVVIARSVVFLEHKKWAWVSTNKERPTTSWSFPLATNGPDVTDKFNSKSGERITRAYASPSTPAPSNSHPHQFDSSDYHDTNVLVSEEEETPSDSVYFDHTPNQGFCPVSDIYQKTEAMKDDQDAL